MIHTLEVSCRSVTYPEMYRDTVFTIVVYLGTYHDTVLNGGVFPCSCVLCFCGCTRVSLCLFWSFEHTCLSPDVSSQGSLSKVSNAEASQLEGTHRVTSGTAYSCEVRSSVCWCRPGWELGSFSCCRPGWKPGILVLRTRLGTWSSRGVDQVGPGNFVLS